MPKHRPGRPGSIRGEASRRGVSEYAIRKERARARVSGLKYVPADERYITRLARGHARPTELRKADFRQWDRLQADLESGRIKHNDPRLHDFLKQTAKKRDIPETNVYKQFFSP